MKPDGIHHITCITADAPGNVDFYARVLGMPFVKKTVNFAAPGEEQWRLPPQHEHRGDRLETTLTPLVDPGALARRGPDGRGWPA
jgi:catechol 2,3-dioxygenase-like lactoylglutathione lyase family enzyme